MKKDKSKKLTLNKETLRDLTATNAGQIKGGAKTQNMGCKTAPWRCASFTCTGW